ncbi:MAG: class I SAM-dependent methyltransferase [Phycisphaerales bacterium]
MTFQDHFSGHASTYAASRPTYPPELFEWVAATAPGLEHVLDCGTGNGQAAVALGEHFASVTAIDPSASQIAAAAPHPNVSYHVAPGESAPVDDASVDALTVAQALHWFDLDAFGREAQRVVRPGGLLAAWSYAISTVDEAVDAVVEALYEGTLGPYWPDRRRHVEAGYATLEIPGEPVVAPPVAMEVLWTSGQYAAYLRSWSATQRYIRERGDDPVAAMEGELARAFGTDQPRRVRWPLHIKATQIG